MENNNGIPQKIANISNLIQKNLVNPNDMSSPNSNKYPQYPGRSSEPPGPNPYLQKVIQDQRQFQNDVHNLLGRINGYPDRTQENSNYPSYPPNLNSGSPSKTFIQVPQYPLQQNNQGIPQYAQPNLPNPDQLQSNRQLKEDNIGLSHQVAQIPNLVRSNEELKNQLLASNNHLQQLQAKLDQQLGIVANQKQQLIFTEQEKINQKRQYDESIVNLQLAQQRQLQQLELQWKEAATAMESNLLQQMALQKTEAETFIRNLQEKVNMLTSENTMLLDKLRELQQQQKEMKQWLERTNQEKQILTSSLQEKQLENDKLQTCYNTSLEKYEANTKKLIQNHNMKSNSYEDRIAELKQHNTQQSEYIVRLETKNKEDAAQLQNQYQKELQDAINKQEAQRVQQVEQCQQYFQKQISNLDHEKEVLFKQKQEGTLVAEQKIAVLLQDNQKFTDQIKQLKQQLLESQKNNANIEQQFTTNANQLQMVNMQLQQKYNDLQEKCKKYPPRTEYNQMSEQLNDMQQQLQYKKDELELLLQHIDQVLNINKQQEQKIETLQSDLNSMQDRNNKENEAYFNQIKSQKSQLSELQRKQDAAEKTIKQNDLIIKELKTQILNNQLEQTLNNNRFQIENQQKDEINRLKQLIEEQKRTIEDYDIKLNYLSSQIDNVLNPELVKSNEMTTQLKNLNSELKAKFENAQKQITDLNTKIADLGFANTKSKASESSLMDLQLELQRKDDRLATINALNKELKFKYDASEFTIIDQNAKIKLLENQVYESDQQCQLLAAQLKQVKREKAQTSLQLMQAGMANLVSQSPLPSQKEI